MKLTFAQRSRLKMITFTLTVLLAIVGSGAGQVTTSSLSGTVVDPQKAVIQRAKVALHGMGNDLVRNVQTNGNGFFQITDLQPGTYQLMIQSSGFSSVQIDSIQMTAAKDVSLGEIKLTPGSVTDTITVNDAGYHVDTESPNNENSLSTEELSKIQVRSYDVMEALTLLPGNTDTASGTRDAPNSNSVANIYTNGIRSNSKNIMIDGVASMDPGTGANVTTLPSIGMIAELKISASNYRADSGRNAGPSVMMTTKSGSQTIHGNFDFPFRNEFFNANSPDAKRLGQVRAPYRLILPSYTLTGPLRVAHVIGKDRHLFFTISEQFQIQSFSPQPQVKYMTVPTARERAGDFSLSTYFNNATGRESPANVMAPAQITQQGMAILNMFPLPNTPNGEILTTPGGLNNNSAYNYSSTNLQTTHRNTNLVRVDWQPSSRFSMYVRGLYTPEVDAADWNPGVNTNSGYSTMGWNVGAFQQKILGTGFLVNFTNTLSSSLVNTVGISTVTNRTIGVPPNPAVVSQQGFLGLTLPSLYPGANPMNYMPNIGFGCGSINPSQTSCSAGNFQNSNLGSYGLDSLFPLGNHLHSYAITDNLTKVLGTHSIVGGLYFENVHRNSLATGNNGFGVNFRGSYSFLPDGTNPCDTGDPYENILVGCIDSYTQSSGRPETFARFHNLELYAQDEWRARPRLTISYGLRFYQDPPAYDAQNQMWDFVPAQYKASLAPRLWQPAYCSPGTLCATTAFTGNCTASLGSSAPLGAYAVDPMTGKTAPAACRELYVQGSTTLANPQLNGMVQAGTNGVPRSVFTEPAFALAPRFGFNWTMTRDGKTVLKGGFGIYYDRFPLQNQLNLLSNPPNSAQSGLSDISGYSQLQTISNQISPPALAAFPLGKQQTPTNHAYSLEIQREVLHDGLVGVAYVGNVSQHLVAAQNINPTPLYSQLYNLSPQNIDPSTYNPLTQTPAGGYGTMLSKLLLVPYKGFGDISMQTMSASANYNSLQLTAAQRLLHRHVQLRGNWTYGKTLGYASNDYFRYSSQAAEGEPLDFYGPLQYDRRHLVNFWFILDFGDPGKKIGSRFVSILARNWSASGIYRFSTGFPFTPQLYLNSIAHSGGAGPVGTSPNAVNGSTDGARPVLVSRSAKLEPGDADNKFAGPQLGGWGNTGEAQFNMPSWMQTDVTFYRNFKPSERLNLTFRTEIYNVPNSTLVSNLNNVLQYSYAGNSIVPGPNQNPYFYRANSGTAAGVNGNITNFFREGRIIQFNLNGWF